MSKDDLHLHIVSFNIPFPPNYGGVIDVFYKIKCLKEAGIKVHLHCYHHDRDPAPELEAYCEVVSYHERRKWSESISLRQPMMVNSRRSDELLEVLCRDRHPIMFEGLHTCYYLDHPLLEDRFKAVRMHNIEWEYYAQLGKVEKRFIKKLYLERESRRLKSFEKKLEHAQVVFPINEGESRYFDKKHQRVVYIPAFHPNTNIVLRPGKGDYILYHGNLSVAENHQAALFLVKEVFSEIKYPFKIAGLSPQADLVKTVQSSRRKHIELIANPSDEEMDELIRNAQIHLLPTFQSTGMKLKLLNTLYRGRYIIANHAMVKNTGLESLCLVADEADKIRELIRAFMFKEFTQLERKRRRDILRDMYHNKKNTEKLIEAVFGEG